MCLLGGVVGAIGFASQETEDMSPAEVTKKLNKCVSKPSSRRFDPPVAPLADRARCEQGCHRTVGKGRGVEEENCTPPVVPFHFAAATSNKLSCSCHADSGFTPAAVRSLG
eukprot:3596004-Rhodomonas_salina.1